MQMDNVLQIISPDPDSQYRLRPCECKSTNVAYVEYQHPDGERWRVQCFDCGKVLAVDQPATRHDLQLLWNTGNNQPQTMRTQKRRK